MQIVINVPENELTEDEVNECIRIAKANFSNIVINNTNYVDCVNRNEVYNTLEGSWLNGLITRNVMCDIRDAIEELPSVVN